MGRTPSERGAYVQRVREDTQRYASELLGENERLRAALASLTQENAKLRWQADRARAELGAVGDRERLLKDALGRVEEENRRFTSRYVEIEQENSDLANLYVASYRLHGTLDRREVLDVIQEIVTNLVGCEEIAIFETDRDGAAVTLVHSCGIDPKAHDRVHFGQGLIGQAVDSGEAYVAVDGGPATTPPEAGLTACIPLKLGDRVTGAIALFRLLPQKAGLGALDRELLELLGTHAATALYCSGLEARLAADAA
jgi:nitrate/nitrite-specific signal transduction histidine kinase